MVAFWGYKHSYLVNYKVFKYSNYYYDLGLISEFAMNSVTPCNDYVPPPPPLPDDIDIPEPPTLIRTPMRDISNTINSPRARSYSPVPTELLAALELNRYHITPIECSYESAKNK